MGVTRTGELSVGDELRIAEEQTPGHKASLGIGNSIVLTPTEEFERAALERWRAEQQVRLAQAAELSELVNESVA